VTSKQRRAGKSLLSVSLDLAGSTEIKQAILIQSEGQPEHRKHLYERYLQLLFSVEHTFYELIEANDVLSIDRLFLVKTIGDEFWYVYEVDHLDVGDLRQSATVMMNVVLGTLYKGLSITLPSGPENDTESEGESAHSHWIKFTPPLKGTMDLLIDVVELNLARYDHIPRQEREQCNRRVVSLYNRLSLGRDDGEEANASVRTDYVGLDVDLFFRITRFCRPGLLLVGDNLMERLDYITSDIQGFEHLDIKTLHQPILVDTATNYVKRNVIAEGLRSDQLQGVGRSYKVYHVFELASLGDSAFYPPPGRRDLMSATRSFLAEHGFYSIKRSEWQP
jgi:hypothetical protein